jgi:hypothetical protein
MCFRIKVVDALEYQCNLPPNKARKSVVISFVGVNSNMFEEINEGSRYRFYNTKPECFYRETFRLKGQSECILLQFQNGKSSLENVATLMKDQAPAQTLELKQRIQKMTDYGKQLSAEGQSKKPQDML